ncbi:MAG: hypothetical protein O2962_08895 [Cyanobacteria bacterium]|nr:hypothetical protein [Cyanobacteriota bacterium]
MQGITNYKPIVVGLGIDDGTGQAIVAPSLSQQSITTSSHGVSAVSYGAVTSAIAISTSKQEADQYFREQAIELSEAWKDFRQELYSNTDPVQREDLDAFFNKVYQVLPPDRQALFQAEVEKTGKTQFGEMDLKDKLRIGSQFAQANAESPIDYQREAFNQLDVTMQDRLVGALLKEYGDDGFDQRYPYVFKNIIRGVIQKRSAEHARSIEKPGLKFLGCGSIGAAFLCQHQGYDAIVKVPLAPEGSDDAQTIKRDKQELEKIRSNMIVSNGTESGTPVYGPERKFFPSLLYDDQGNHLGSDEVLVTRFYDGEPIHSKDPDHDDENIRICPEEYIKEGIDDRFLDEFIEAYVRHSTLGSDLFDLSVHNTFYKDGRLQFFETTGFADEATQKVNDFRKNHPVAALLKTLMTDVLLFETFHNSNNKNIVERSVEKHTQGQVTAQEFWDSRYSQMKQGLLRAVDAGVFSVEDLSQAIKGLRENTSESTQIGRFKNLFTREALEYLSRLENTIT